RSDVACCLFTLLFGSAVYFGAQFIGRMNSRFMALLGICYLGLVAIGLGHIKGENLELRSHWRESFGAFSMILATYSYQMVVPSVCSFLGYDAAKLRKAILIGTTVPFVIYSIWIFVIHGVVPLEEAGGLREAWVNGQAATSSLHKQLNYWLITGLADAFAFLAVVTSYFGLSMALFHFLNDCFTDIRIRTSRNMVVLLTLVPVLILAILYPRALLQFLDISGGYGDTILSGLIPVTLVWVGRYYKNLQGEYTAPGGKLALIATGCFFLWILLLQMV
ncbi:MAG: hypothetical protein JSR46_04700, partial [Verrucomicrobia bacterium]|nr:hypothetical protein [Verrucomicrobiota bacterium]